jgi:alkylation response protein AidB-like acyl-CoA dehydrogenase
MTFLLRERNGLERLLPGFDATLAAHSLSELERPDGTAIRLLRGTRAAGLLVPTDCGGLGASPSSVLLVQRAIGARAPSLAVATTMHHFSVASLLQYSLYEAQGRLMLAMVASQGFLVASGFAEGRTGSSILEANLRAEWTGSSYRLKGSKKPCSLSRSMDLLSASVLVVRGSLPPTRGVLVLSATAPGIERRPFWRTPVLAAAESDELVLDGVEVPAEAIIGFGPATQGPDPIELGGLCWFTLMISASYLGIASGLVERVLRERRGSDYERVAIAGELEASMSALEGLASRMVAEPLDEQALTHAQFVRYSVQDAIQRATSRAVELAGGMAFIGSEDVSYLLAASRALAFHPPGRSFSVPMLAESLVAARPQEGVANVAA